MSSKWSLNIEFKTRSFRISFFKPHEAFQFFPCCRLHKTNITTNITLCKQVIKKNKRTALPYPSKSSRFLIVTLLGVLFVAISAIFPCLCSVQKTKTSLVYTLEAIFILLLYYFYFIFLVRERLEKVTQFPFIFYSFMVFLN